MANALSFLKVGLAGISFYIFAVGILIFFPTSLWVKRDKTLFPSSDDQLCTLPFSPLWLNKDTNDSLVFVSGSDSWINSINSILPRVLFCRGTLVPRRYKYPLLSQYLWCYLHRSLGDVIFVRSIVRSIPNFVSYHAFLPSVRYV